MTQLQALAKAKQLWGPKASAAERDDRYGIIYYGRYNINSGTFACNDGKGKVGIWGNGQTWEAAFEDAKRQYKYWELR